MDGKAAHPRLTHQRLDSLLENQVSADKEAKYAKYLYLNLPTLSPYVSGPNSVKVATPLNELEAQNIKVDRAYLVSYTNSRASDLAAAAKVFKDAAKANGEKIPRRGCESLRRRCFTARTANCAGSWRLAGFTRCWSEAATSRLWTVYWISRGLLEPGEVGISASNRNFKEE
jgi:homoaconitate hydratase